MENGIQYTLRGVPDHVDRALREKAAMCGLSLNRVALEVLEQGLGVAPEPRRFHDLDYLAGTWVDDPAFDRVIEEMDLIEEPRW